MRLILRTDIARAKRALACLSFALLTLLSPAQASTAQTGIDVTLPNGYASLDIDDLRLKTPAGDARWRRVWDGTEWKFNPHWENLSQSWKNLTGSQTADTTAGTGSNVGNEVYGQTVSGCWVWVDEDWSPTASSGTVSGGTTGGTPAIPMIAARTTPFNRTMSGAGSQDYPPPAKVDINYALLCAGSSTSSTQSLEGVRRLNELYLGENGRYAFDNRTVLEKRSVQGLPPITEAQLSTGTLAIAPTPIANGYRWQDRGGDWIDYNTQGQVIAHGDKNNNTLWLARDSTGTLRGVVGSTGHVLYTLHYSGELLTEIRDYPIAGNPLDLPARSIKYRYDSLNRLTQATDARGNTTQYDYDSLNRLIKITDPENHIEQLAYNSNMVAKRTAPDGGVTDYEFEYDDTHKQFASKITGPETPAGRRVENDTHNRVGKLVRKIVNGLTTDEVRYDTGARAETHTNARGYTQILTKNEFDQIVQTQNEDGTVTGTKYEARYLNPVEKTDEAGIKTQYQYDAKGNRIKKIEAAGTPDERTTEYTLNSLGQTTGITRKGRTEANGTVTPDATWQLEYDAQGQISKATDPEGNVRQYLHNRAGNLVKTTDPRGNATLYEADAGGNLVKVTDALGHARSYQYDKAGNLVTYTDARAKATQAAYDAMNRATRITNPVGGAFKLQYNGQGIPVAETDEDGRSSSAEFDNFLRLSKQIDGLGNITQYSYQITDGSSSGTLGALYQPTETKYPTFTERSRYDQRERPTSDTLLNPNSQGTEGLVSSTEYDKRGQVKSETDANGKTRTYSYDALGQIKESTDSLGGKTQAQYDARGNLTQITDARGNANKFEYDRNNRVVKEILPLGQTTLYQYDEAGNLTQRIDPNGNKTAYSFDAANRLTEVKRYNAGNTLQHTTVYTWDAADNLTGWSDTDPTRNQTSSATATYDDANRKTGETVTYPSGNTLSYGYAYSPAGYKTQLTWPDGSQIGYSYSGHGELESVTILNEGTISVNQFKWTAPAKITLPGGTTQERTLDGLLKLEGLKVKTPGQQTVLSLANTYGKVQELKQSNRTDTANGGSTSKTGSYSYDDEVRLTQAETDSGGPFGSDTETFTLDAVGNRIAHSKVSGAWTYDANNRLTQRGEGSNATTYVYDEAGNQTKKTEGTKVTQYGYDTQNRLIEVKDGANNLIARYGYDPLGRRMWKEQYRDGQGNTLTTQKRTHYLYADEGLIAEATQDIALNADNTVTASGTPQIATQYGPRPDAEFTTGVLFVKTINSNAESIVAYYHHDAIGTPLQATDKQGNVVWAASYNVFGQATIVTSSPTADRPTITSSLRLPGQIEDAETGLHYNNQRYYEPATGRYITQDPIGLEGGINPYRYAEADPVNLSDPTGECPMCVAYAVCVAECMLEDAAGNAMTGSCNNWGGSAKGCATSCLLGPLGQLGKWFGRAKRLACNSFPADTLVHVKPKDAKGKNAQMADADLKAISQIQVGDEVLAFAEWKDRGTASQLDERLSYEKVTDVFTSVKAQMLVHLTLSDGQTLTATEGHPFKTAEGWRDAILLKKGGQLLLKGGDGDAERTATIVDIRTETKTLPVFNLEVANAHTYFVGVGGELVHNSNCSWSKARRDYWKKNSPTGEAPTRQVRVRDNKTGREYDRTETKELHHKDPQRDNGSHDPANLNELWPTEHSAADPFRRPGYTVTKEY